MRKAPTTNAIVSLSSGADWGVSCFTAMSSECVFLPCLASLPGPSGRNTAIGDSLSQGAK